MPVRRHHLSRGTFPRWLRERIITAAQVPYRGSLWRLRGPEPEDVASGDTFTPMAGGWGDIATDNYLGAAMNYTPGAREGFYTSGGAYTGTAGRAVTMAAVCVFDSLARRTVCASSSNTGGYRLQLGLTGATSNVNIVEGGIADNDMNITLSTGEPWFVCVSVGSAVGATFGAAVAKNMLTGRIYASSKTISGSVFAGDGNTVFARSPFSSTFDFDGRMSMGAVLWEGLTLDEMQAWAEDPFGVFDQPSPFPFFIGEPAVGGSFQPAWAANATRTISGGMSL